ncbi:uncharacterized protein LOC141630586 [Silene latifolia]|uniref:uncharacterized protein LOC141630586 n=1 Tax=Silene latifolia TaxID=37657 RepID=UPI003D7862BE
MMLAEFDLTFMALKSIKGKAISNYLADFPVSEDQQEAYNFPDEEIFVIDDEAWQLFFDGASNQKGYGIGVLLISPYGAHTPLSVKLDFSVTNNEAEYEAYALAKLASMINIPNELENIPLCIERREEPAYCMALDDTIAADDAPWFTDVLNYQLGRGFPPYSDVRTQRAIKRFAAQFILSQGKLYKKSQQGILLLCVDEKEAKRIMEEVHNAYTAFIVVQFGITLAILIWGIDIIGKITPKGTGGHEFILVAIAYFTKWVEAASYATLTSKHVAKFITENIIYRYGVPHELISDHGSHFKKDVAAILTHYKIQQRKSSTYRPQMNGVVEAANKNEKTKIEKMTEKYHDWPAKLPFALWGYRTSVRTPTSATPYSLVYGMEAVLPIELEIPSLRIELESQIPEVDWVQARYEELLLIDEKRLAALNQVQMDSSSLPSTSSSSSPSSSETVAPAVATVSTLVTTADFPCFTGQ